MIIQCNSSDSGVTHDGSDSDGHMIAQSVIVQTMAKHMIVQTVTENWIVQTMTEHRIVQTVTE